jgi:hypothetical protein
MQIAPYLERREGYLKATFAGRATLDECLAMMQLVRHATIEFADTKLLLNLTPLEEAFRSEDEAVLGAHVTRAFAHLKKVASLVPPGRRTGVSQRTAGAFPLRVFDSEKDAVGWLLA